MVKKHSELPKYQVVPHRAISNTLLKHRVCVAKRGDCSDGVHSYGHKRDVM